MKCYVVAAGGTRIANLVQAASRLGEVVVVAVGPKGVAEAVRGEGVSQVVWWEATADQAVEGFAPGVAAYICSAPGTVFAGRNPADRVVAGAIAAALPAPVLTDVSTVEFEDGALVAIQTVYGGIAQRTQRFADPVVVIADGGGVLAPGTAPVTPMTASPVPIQVVGLTHPISQPVDLARSRRVVGIGSGLKAAQDLALVEALAAALGADLGCSRPLAEGLGWLPKDRYIGISGQHIAPEVYLAIGISGQLQHLSGCRDAATIVAINTDAAAPIMSQADYVCVADLYRLVPALTHALTGGA